MMRDLTVEDLRELLAYDPETGLFTWLSRTAKHCASELSAKRWNVRFAGKPAFTTPHSAGYLEARVLWTAVLAHRAAWAMHYGVWPSDQIDHINGDRTDNRIVNLREADQTLNNRNLGLSRRNKSGTVGVSMGSKGKWIARICEGGKVIHLGSFANLDDAIAARSAALVRHGYHKNHGRVR